jgi:recombinational DNA repair protein RecR
MNIFEKCGCFLRKWIKKSTHLCESCGYVTRKGTMCELCWNEKKRFYCPGDII